MFLKLKGKLIGLFNIRTVGTDHLPDNTLLEG